VMRLPAWKTRWTCVCNEDPCRRFEGLRVTGAEPRVRGSSGFGRGASLLAEWPPQKTRKHL
jgi:hypothetical protein